MRFGELLVMNGLITEQQLDECLRMQLTTRKKLGALLVELGHITERQIVEVLEFQLGFPSVALFETVIERNAIELIPEKLASKHTAIPVRKANGKLIVAMEDPLDYIALEELRLSANIGIQPVIAAKSEIDQTISRYYGLQSPEDDRLDESYQTESSASIEHDVNDQSSPIVKLVNQMIQSAVIQRASDIHVEPQERHVTIRFRVDGVLHTEKKLTKSMQNMLIARLKIMAKLNITERRLPQDGRIQMQIDGRQIDIRVSTLPAAQGESVVLRILDQSVGIKRMDELGLSERNLQSIDKVIRKPNGIVLISGPTGSGKTSTLYSAVGKLNRPDVKIVTVEDPVEYQMEGITQVQVNTQVGLTFASGLRSILRQDPNIVMVGEVRDAETAEIAVRASLTGHLVFSTIHTNSAIATISRLIDMGVEPYMIASSLNCIVAQRLVRRVCRECAVKVAANDDEARLIGSFGLNSQDQQSRNQQPFVTRGTGCVACNKSGYKGRLALHELLVIDEGLRRLIARGASIEEMKGYATVKLEFRSLMHDGLEKMVAGLTTTEELLKVVSEDD